MKNEDVLVSIIIIINYNTLDYIKQLLISISSTRQEVSFEIVIVDNSGELSNDIIPEKLVNKTRILFPDKNLGFGRANNLGARESKGRFLCFVNPDIIFTNKTRLNILVGKLMQKNSTGCVGPQLLTEQGLHYRNWRKFPNELSFFFLYSGLSAILRPLRRKKFFKDKLVDQLDGAFFMVKKSLYFELGGFVPNFFVYYEDVDFFRRIAMKNYKVILTPEVNVKHFGSSTSGKSLVTTLSSHIHGLTVYINKLYHKNL